MSDMLINPNTFFAFSLPVPPDLFSVCSCLVVCACMHWLCACMCDCVIAGVRVCVSACMCWCVNACMCKSVCVCGGGGLLHACVSVRGCVSACMRVYWTLSLPAQHGPVMSSQLTTAVNSVCSPRGHGPRWRFSPHASHAHAHTDAHRCKQVCTHTQPTCN